MAVLDECTPWVKIDSMISAMIFFFALQTN